MSTDLYLTCPIPPSVNHYLAYRGILKGGRPMAVSYKTKEAVQYQEWLKNYVQQEVINQGWELLPNSTQHFYIDTDFYFGRVRSDCNNYFKVLLDAITNSQCIWLDDNVTCERVNRIYYINSENSHMDIHIHPVDYIGIFDDMAQLNNFRENNCIDCKRCKRNCSLFASAVAGRIQDGVTSTSCNFKQKSKK